MRGKLVNIARLHGINGLHLGADFQVLLTSGELPP